MSRSSRSRSSIGTTLLGLLILAAIVVARLLGVTLPGENNPPSAVTSVPGSSGPSAGGLPAQSFKQNPKEITFHSCPPDGAGGDPGLNQNKNRVDEGNFQPTPFSTILNLEGPRVPERAGTREQPH